MRRGGGCGPGHPLWRDTSGPGRGLSPHRAGPGSNRRAAHRTSDLVLKRWFKIAGVDSGPPGAAGCKLVLRFWEGGTGSACLSAAHERGRRGRTEELELKYLHRCVVLYQVHFSEVYRILLVSVPAVVFMTLILQKYGSPLNDFKEDLRRSLSEGPEKSSENTTPSKAGTCAVKRECPEDFFSFFVQSGAATVLAPKICLDNDLVLGTVMNNAGIGINLVIANSTTGGVIKTGNFDMYSGEVKPLIEFLESIETGSLVLMASYDEPSSKLTIEARNLIAALGSSYIKSVGFRDNWVFVGGKDVSVLSNFEKYLKNDSTKNKYEDWPELIEIYGCIAKDL
ncbi:protein FAM3D [Anoplopoma fimbria]|uniref:protein FAM3D n=1 Tax=Anoplopoma fimbria TaxID=229290 RepID=UPI0023EB59C7|nr:protein FAM3D [Anoplopoma fimbria]